MNYLKLSIVIIALFFNSCTKHNADTETFNLIGTWIEKYPEMYDGVKDTIVFTDDLKIEKHFFYTDYNYLHKPEVDTIIIFNNWNSQKFYYELKNTEEIKIYNFLDRLTTAQEKNISFTKDK